MKPIVMFDHGPLQIEPPGFMAIQLPWSDDIRAPEAEPFHVGTSHPKASDEAVG